MSPNQESVAARVICVVIGRARADRDVALAPAPMCAGVRNDSQASAR